MKFTREEYWNEVCGNTKYFQAQLYAYSVTKVTWQCTSCSMVNGGNISHEMSAQLNAVGYTQQCAFIFTCWKFWIIFYIQYYTVRKHHGNKINWWAPCNPKNPSKYWKLYQTFFNMNTSKNVGLGSSVTWIAYNYSLP